MEKQILFIQGGGKGGYEVDEKMVQALQIALGKDYAIRYPRLLSDEAAPDFGWVQQIGDEIAKCENHVILVAHSLGASMLLKCFSENEISGRLWDIFLIATPFWMGNEEWQQGLKLRNDFAKSLPENIRLRFYHCRDDEEVPFNHLAEYKRRLPMATFHEFKSGGHQLENSIQKVAEDIKIAAEL